MSQRPYRAVIGRIGTALAVVAALSACSVDRAMRADTYTVARGDTLSEIAQRFNVSWRELADWNRIDPPYRLNVGQTLYLKPFPPIDYSQVGTAKSGTRQPAPVRRPPDAPTARPTRASTGPQPTSSITRASVERVTPRAAGGAANAGDTEPPTGASAVDTGSPSIAEATTSAPDDAPDDQAARSQEIETATAKADDTAGDDEPTIRTGGPSEDGWQWPATGKLTRSYGGGERGRGIEITGNTGSAIYAASSGTVVYNGTGLKGYGQLIIIKHDAHYLSAYGFVRDSRVSQGETVAAGQQIAEMGLGPGNKPLLHFEIRRDGKPIDPEKRLPKR
ncbi:peptidoglycan DD-metalloendopeptidase family protein [uncultured Salinisphaera sp.]|uniref:peptidoglycan DD-metalloendopeptidase family protein n=1 Tax=uncultured Salinisphaera sp. TaxID=359372 RepID=UPI0032B18C08|tara:strand:- start:43 stop:1044 length:1002 start_codon:yes stop_codon:yes gene_type:complete